MGRITEKDKKGLQQLVIDCGILGLTEQESLEYIQKRCGIEINPEKCEIAKARIAKEMQGRKEGE